MNEYYNSNNGYNPDYNQNYNYNYNQIQEKPKSNSLSVAALVCGLVALCCCNPLYLVSAASVIVGIIALVNKGTSGKGMAVAGICCGVLSVIICIIVDICLLPFTMGASFFF